MPIKSEHRPVFQRLLRQHNIVFTDAIPSGTWPSSHRDVFESIEKIKQFKYDTYAAAHGDDEFDCKGKAKEYARKLTEKAKDCVSRSEATWRLACEPLVFSRLTSEIACKRCRKRVWRSEVEASLGGDTRAAANLKQRQERRDPCRCPRSTRPNDEDERVGLNRLFIDRADDKVVHPPNLTNELPQEQRPDRIYGLRQTRNLEDLMFKELGNGEFIEDRLQRQPHPAKMGEALLFPFLVVEAKAGNAPDDWSSIRLQTAFPIYTYLNVQESLRSATSHRSKWTSGPLVWFLMSRGDDWRLSLAYHEPRTSRASSRSSHHTTKVAQVWTGCISDRNDALQLFLIVDYMADWARDAYRPSILTELRIVASVAPDVATVITDTDVYSSGNVLPSSGVDETLLSGPSELQAAFRALDSPSGTVRHIAPIESRCLSLFITADNIDTFVRSTNRNIRQHFLRRVLDRFHTSSQRPCLLSLNQLNAMEETWTGQSRPGASFSLRGKRYYTVHLVTYSLSPCWEQVRELCIIAVAEDAFDILIAESKLKTKDRKRGKARRPPLVTDGADFPPGQSLTDRLLMLRNAPAKQNLMAVVTRTAGYIDTSPDLCPSSWAWFQIEEPFIWELVSNTYKVHRRGDFEPELPFLHISRTYDMQIVNDDDSNTAAPDVASRADSHREGLSDLDDDSTSTSNHEMAEDTGFECEAHPDDLVYCSCDRPSIPTFKRTLRVSSEGAILVHGGLNSPRAERSPSPLCVYIVHGDLVPPSTEDLGRIIKRTFEDWDVYHTTRDHGNLNLKEKMEYRKIWNLRQSYGVFFSYGSSSFVKWLRDLAQPLPTRQGSPRGRFDSGRSIFGREYSPWHDPRLIHGGPFGSLKRRFLKQLITAETVAWCHIALEKSRTGVDCCVLCAREGGFSVEDDSDTGALTEDDLPERLCDDCLHNLFDYDGEWLSWIKEAICETIGIPESEDSPHQTPEYDIATPPPWSERRMRLRFRKMVEDPDGNYHTSDSEFDSKTTSSDVAPSRRSPRSTDSYETLDRLSIANTPTISQEGHSEEASIEARVATRKRKRSSAAGGLESHF